MKGFQTVLRRSQQRYPVVKFCSSGIMSATQSRPGPSYPTYQSCSEGVRHGPTDGPSSSPSAGTLPPPYTNFKSLQFIWVHCREV